MHLLQITLEQNYFTFNGKFYLQDKGLAMGSPLSSILSEIYLNKFENENIFSDKNKQASKILFYRRYVDDTFLIYNGNTRQLHLFSNYLNSLSENIKFTLETENNSAINFLDLTLFKENSNLKYKIYRKPTTTDHTIHASSNHPQSHKMAAYNSFVNRLLKVPMSPEAYNNEYLILKYIAIQNGYPSSIIDTIINKQNRKNNSIVDSTDSNKKNFVSIEFGDNLHYTIKNELRKHNIILSNKTSNRLERHLNNKSRPANDDLNGTGVYKLTCNDCPKQYIGQSGRSFRTRFREHLPKPKLRTQRSKFAEHLALENHNVNNCESNLHVLHKCTKGPIMNVLENFEIYRAFKISPNTVLNEKLKSDSNILFDRIEALNNIRNADNNQQLIPPPQTLRHQTGIG